MIDDDIVPVAVASYRDTAQVKTLLDALRTAEGQRRETFRALRPYIVTIPQGIVTE